MESPIRVVIADDHRVVVESLSALLDLDDEFKVVCTATALEDAVECVSQTRPDVAVFDIDFQGQDAFDVVPRLIQQVPETKVVFLTAHLSDAFISQAIRMQARGYLLKDEPAAEVRNALRKLHAGEYVFSPSVQERLVWDSKAESFRLRVENALCSLSIQQLAILRHLARGKSVKEIAVALGRSEKSIDSHKYRIMNRLGIHDRVELCRFAIREGLTLV